MPVIALIIGVLLAAADQIIKYFVLTYLQPVGSVTAINNIYYVQEETVGKDVLYFCGAYNRRRNR